MRGWTVVQTRLLLFSASFGDGQLACQPVSQVFSFELFSVGRHRFSSHACGFSTFWLWKLPQKKTNVENRDGNALAANGSMDHGVWCCSPVGYAVTTHMPRHTHTHTHTHARTHKHTQGTWKLAISSQAEHVTRPLKKTKTRIPALVPTLQSINCWSMTDYSS